MKKYLALLLALVMVFALFAGCSSSSGNTTEPAPAAETTPAAAEPAPATEEPAPAAETAPAAEEPASATEPAPAAAEPAPAEEPSAVAPPSADAVSAISYPLEGNPEIVFWTSIRTPHGFFIPSMEWNDMLCMPAFREQTGADFQIISINDTIASEQYNLMVASGDWPDYSQVAQFYTGGLAQAYEDDVILELDDELLSQNAPDYYVILNQLSQQDYAYTLTNGTQMAVYTIADGVTRDQGLVTRADWYEEMGSPELNSLEAVEKYLYDIKAAHDTESTIEVQAGAALTDFNDVFGMYIPSYSGSDLAVYVIDDQVITPYTLDEYRTYLEWVVQLYADKIIYQDFYSLDQTVYNRFQDIANDQIGLWNDGADSLSTPNMYRPDGAEPLVMKPLPAVTDGDGVNNFGSYRSVVGNSYSIYADADAETVLQFFNYFFTHDGYILANYGIQGDSYDTMEESYYINEDGEYCYTALIIDNIRGTMPSNALDAYVGTHVPCYSLAEKMFTTFADYKLEAVNLWSYQPLTYELEYPTGAGLTSEEQDQLTNPVSDMMTVISEEVLSMIIGSKPLNDDTWAAYVARVESMGLDNVLSIYQNAYEEYQRGERYNVSASAGPGGPAPGGGGAPGGEGGAPGGEGGAPEGEGGMPPG